MAAGKHPREKEFMEDLEKQCSRHIRQTVPWLQREFPATYEARIGEIRQLYKRRLDEEQRKKLAWQRANLGL